MKKITLFLFLISSPLWAAWVLIAPGTGGGGSGVWKNGTTGQIFYSAGQATYPPAVNTFTPTFTPTATFTPGPANTPTFTPTPNNKTSSVQTADASGHWFTMTNNFIVLGLGTWQVNGVVVFGNNGSSPAYTNLEYMYGSANGANNNSQPTSINATLSQIFGGITRQTSNFNNVPTSTTTWDSYVFTCEPFIISVGSAPMTIYLDPFASMTTAANTQIYTNIWANYISSTAICSGC